MLGGRGGRICFRQALVRCFGFGIWTGREPELAILNNNRKQRQHQDQQGEEHPAALLLFESRMGRGITRLCAAILLQHRHRANSLAEPGTCCLVCLEIARKASIETLCELCPSTTEAQRHRVTGKTQEIKKFSVAVCLCGGGHGGTTKTPVLSFSRRVVRGLA